MPEQTGGTPFAQIIQAWEFSKSHVDKSIDSGRFISSKTILLIAVANIENVLTQVANGNRAAGNIQGTPIGVVTNWSITQQKMLQQLFEVGSGLPYFIPGNTTSVLSLTRVVYTGGTVLGNLYNFNSLSQKDALEAGFKISAADTGGVDEWFAINLAAKAFDKPTTLLWVFKNNEQEDWKGAYLFKNAYIESHNMTSDAQSIVIMENATMRFEAAYPMEAAGGTG